MLGSLIARIREEKQISKSDLSKATNINVGHLTHIEKGERNPSQKTLKSICDALDVPYQQLSYAYDKELTENQKKFNLINNIAYDKVPLVTSIEGFVDCPSSIPYASLAFRMPDDGMKATYPKGTILYLEFNAIPEHREIRIIQI